MSNRKSSLVLWLIGVDVDKIQAGLRIVPFWRGTVCTVRTFNQSHFKMQDMCSTRNQCLSYERQVYALCPSGVVQFAQFEHSISRNSCSVRNLCLSYERQIYALCPSPVVQFAET